MVGWDTVALSFISPALTILKASLNSPAKWRKVKKYILQIIAFAEVAKVALQDDPDYKELQKAIEAGTGKRNL